MLTSRLILCVLSIISGVAAGTRAQAIEAKNISSNLLKINSGVLVLKQDLKNYNGSTARALVVSNATIQIHNANRAAYAYAKSFNGSLTTTGSSQVIKTLTDNLVVSIPATLQVLQQKKPLFDAANLTAGVEALLNLLQQDHCTLSIAIGSHLNGPSAACGLAGACKIYSFLDFAARLYSNGTTPPTCQLTGACKAYYQGTPANCSAY